ncbi:MAG: ATP-binding protein [Archaeoglobaceae archaeon]
MIIRSIDAYGHMRWIEARSRFAEMNGKPYCLLVYTDVSDRIALQKRIEELNEYLKLLNSMLRHDILNIFTRIYSFLELFEEEFSLELLKGDTEAEVLANEGIYNIFGNLIGNAVKHGKATEVRVKISSNEENVEILLEDNGIGIPKENVQKLFTKGFTTGGSGLGLFIVKQLIKNLDGDIELVNPERSAFLLKFKKKQAKEDKIFEKLVISASSSP